MDPLNYTASLEVYFKAPYAVNVEYGTEPGESNVTAEQIYNWIINKGIADELLGNKRNFSYEYKTWKLKTISYNIAHHIQVEGIPPTFFFTRAFHKVVLSIQIVKFNLALKGKSVSFVNAW